jgi:FtsP/CotA-like multicopper oxidase with cupredoxin domain
MKMNRLLVLTMPALLALALGGTASAQTPPSITCPSTVPSGEELRDLPELKADKNHVLSTTFTVEVKQQCVPSQDPQGNWIMTSVPLRTFVYPDPATQQLRWGYPGPTLRIRKQEEIAPAAKGKPAQVTPGDRVKVLLVNNLTPDTVPHGKCDDACAGTGVNCQTVTPPTPAACAKAAGATPPSILPGCCCLVNQNQTWPECFHGDNTTNLHFHGTHVSPQSPQDFVLLELRPKLPAGAAPPADDHPMSPRGTVAYGQFQYDVDPPPPTQAEGTHWYHPHKHGSVSLQVANGMPGALIIEGKFDDWLRSYYGGKLVEKTLVLQQVQPTTNLYNDPVAPPYLVNGQVSPTVHMKAGEVQRWRFVNATMQVAAQVSLNFPPNVKMRQIAMDGVRFSPENYTAQPLFKPTDPSEFDISPGNRADFLIQAPTAPGLYRVTHHLTGKSAVSGKKREKLRLRDQALLKLEPVRNDLKALGRSSEPALVTLVVEAPAKEKAVKKAALATGFPTPTQWPKMPWYLQNLPADNKDQQNMDFQMTGGPGDPTTQFKINGEQYNPNCSNVTTKLGTTDTWTVQNSSPLAHPFHIHINPFQLVEEGTVINGKPVPFVKYASPVWQDTVSLPVQNSTWDVNAGPIWNDADAKTKCPTTCAKYSTGTWNNQWKTTVPGKMSVCGCSYTGNGYALFRHRYLDFTGEYVLHCHFLGHEDRGMMFNVQTVCKDEPAKFGKAVPFPKPECVPGNLIPADPVCPPAGTASGAAGHAGHAEGPGDSM